MIVYFKLFSMQRGSPDHVCVLSYIHQVRQTQLARFCKDPNQRSILTSRSLKFGFFTKQTVGGLNDILNRCYGALLYENFDFIKRCIYIIVLNAQLYTWHWLKPNLYKSDNI